MTGRNEVGGGCKETYMSDNSLAEFAAVVLGTLTRATH